MLKALCFLSVPPGIQNYRNGQNEIFHRLSCKSALQLSKTTKPAVMNDMPASQRFGNTLLLNRDGLPVDLLSKFFLLLFVASFDYYSFVLHKSDKSILRALHG